jgi:hypothetical protein
MTLEEYTSQINENIFLREFSFARNEFSPAQESELQFSDQVIWLDELLITFQLKERELSGKHTRQTEEKWFQKKIIGKATKQIRDTLDYLARYDEINITNGRGHVFNVSAARKIKPINVVSYAPHKLLPRGHTRKKFHLSSTAGFIHLIPIEDWLGICHSLITPAEIVEYLAFRQEIGVKHESKVNALPEQALIGQFLYGTLDEEPALSFTEYLELFVQAYDEFGMSHIFSRFADRIVKIIEFSPSRVVAEEHRYYDILKELAKLNRNELKLFKIRYDLCVEKCKTNEFTLPFRFTSPRTGCGFVFIVIPKEHTATTINALQNFTAAHRYDQRLTKCIGISFANNGEYYDIGWCFQEEPWIYDAEMEQRLNEQFPFLEVKEEVIPRYRFAGCELQ